MRLRLGGWARIELNNELDVFEAMQVIQTLYAEASGTSRLSKEGLEMLESMAPIVIGGMVRDLNEVKQHGSGSSAEQFVPAVPEAAGRTTVRDASCSCGSRRPYNRCCGAH